MAQVRILFVLIAVVALVVVALVMRSSRSVRHRSTGGSITERSPERSLDSDQVARLARAEKARTGAEMDFESTQQLDNREDVPVASKVKAWTDYLDKHRGAGHRVAEAQARLRHWENKRRQEEARTAAERAFADAEALEKDGSQPAEKKAGAWDAYLAQYAIADYRMEDARVSLAKWKEIAATSDYTEDAGLDLGLKMVWIRPGSFRMGSSTSEAMRGDDEGPVRDVTLDRFWLGRHEVTQAQYEKIMGSNPSRFRGPGNPVDSVSWYDAVAFCHKLTQAAGRKYVLPTEAQWEYACRAGTTTAFHFGETISTDQANFDGSHMSDGRIVLQRDRFRNTTLPVGSLGRNEFGLFDMHGNVWEWCSDWYGPYGARAERNPTGAADGRARVLRGGSWYAYARYCRSADRGRLRPVDANASDGFRVARAEEVGG